MYSRRSTQTTGFGQGLYTPSPPHTQSCPLCYGPLIYVCSVSVHSPTSPHPLLPTVLRSPYLCVLDVCTLPPPPHTHSYLLCYGPLIYLCSGRYTPSPPHTHSYPLCYGPLIYLCSGRYTPSPPHTHSYPLCYGPLICVCSVSVHSPHLPIPTLAHCATVPRVSWSNFYLKIVG